MLGHTIASFFKSEGYAEGYAKGYTESMTDAIIKLLNYKFGNFDEYKFLYSKLLHVNNVNKLGVIFDFAIKSKSINGFISDTNIIE
jgi:hypothetical protein